MLLALMFAYPGKKLLFMGDEFAAPREWNHDGQLDWNVLDDPLHAGVARLVRDCNRLYRQSPALFERDCEPQGFEWLDFSDSAHSIFAFARHGSTSQSVVVLLNATPIVRYGYRIGVPQAGTYCEAINSDSAHYGGSNVGNEGALVSEAVGSNARANSLLVTLPPLATLVFTCDPATGGS
jgi:1,4-alpha-glucan branching enzyme